MSGNITSAVSIIQKISMFSYSYSWAGAGPSGNISVQVSNDYALDPQGNVKNAGTWNTLTLDSAGTATTSISVSGNTGTGFIDIDQCGAYAVRTLYVRTSGTGTLQSTINGKVS
jgi:hypothetical protein